MAAALVVLCVAAVTAQGQGFNAGLGAGGTFGWHAEMSARPSDRSVTDDERDSPAVSSNQAAYGWRYPYAFAWEPSVAGRPSSAESGVNPGADWWGVKQ